MGEQENVKGTRKGSDHSRVVGNLESKLKLVHVQRD